MSETTITGALSGQAITLPDVNAPPMPSLASPGVVQDGEWVEGFGEIGDGRSYPDVRSFRRKFGLLIPATNLETEDDLLEYKSASRMFEDLGSSQASDSLAPMRFTSRTFQIGPKKRRFWNFLLPRITTLMLWFSAART